MTDLDLDAIRDRLAVLRARPGRDPLLKMLAADLDAMLVVLIAARDKAAEAGRWKERCRYVLTEFFMASGYGVARSEAQADEAIAFIELMRDDPLEPDGSPTGEAEGDLTP